MTKKRWFRFYIDAWLNGTFGLTPNEIAAYVTILCELYDHDGFAKLDAELLARRCSMRPTSFRKALDVLVERGKLTLEGEFITSKAVSEEIKSREKLDQKSGESRERQARKENEIKGIRQKIPPNTEERIQNNKPLDVGALHPAKAPTSEAVANFVKRRAMFQRKAS